MMQIGLEISVINFVEYRIQDFSKILINHLQAVLCCLIEPEQTCTIKSKAIQNNLHLVCTILEKVNTPVALMNYS